MKKPTGGVGVLNVVDKSEEKEGTWLQVGDRSFETVGTCQPASVLPMPKLYNQAASNPACAELRRFCLNPASLELSNPASSGATGF